MIDDAVIYMVREVGIEPTRPKTGDFKSPMATITSLSQILVPGHGFEPRTLSL